MKQLSLLFMILLLFSCNKPNQVVLDEYKSYSDKLSNLIVTHDNTQIFKLSSQHRKTITARNGLKIDFDANKLMTDDGSSLGDTIIVKVTECFNQSDFIRSNVRTISNNRLLISGGAYNIEMFSSGKVLRLKDSDSISVHLPRFTNDEMALFYGQKDNLDQVEWTETKGSLTAADRHELTEQGDSTDSSIEYEYYNPIKISSLGWINCDRFYGQNDLTNLDYTFSTSEDTLFSKVLIIFKDINSVTSQYYIKSRKNIKYEGFQNIPTGANVSIVAVSVLNDQIFGYSKDIKTQENLKIEIDLNIITEQELNKIIIEI